MLRLISIPASHYCEKARWAMDRAGIAFKEEGHLPFFSRLATWRAGKKGSVPVLVTPEGLITDSTEILRWVDTRLPVDARLFPEDGTRPDVEAWEARFDDELGPATRRLGYMSVIDDKPATLALMRGRVAGAQVALMSATFPIVRNIMKRSLKLDEAGAARSRQRLARLFDDVDARLADGRRMLTGDRFTAADLTFAALAAPLLLPARYGGVLPTYAQLAPAYRADVDAFRSRPCGRFAQRLYDEVRGVAAR